MTPRSRWLRPEPIWTLWAAEQGFAAPLTAFDTTQEQVMFGLGTTELMIIMVLVLIIFGAGKLPQVGGALGQGLRNFKKGMNDAVEVEAKESPVEIENG
jgi:sec-independent protein translocase protein TatA